MAEIAPFRGIRYAVERVGSLEAVVAPPYDVISPDERASILARSPWNVARIDLPEGDDEDRYARAARRWRTWRAEGILRSDPEPAIYALEERFTTPQGNAGIRRGFIAALKLEEFGTDTIAPHERTFAGPKEDRLQLMRATRANLSQIFALYRDPKQQVASTLAKATRRRPDVVVDAPDGERRMWVISDAECIACVQRALADSALTIADGHHRYETALIYRDECRRRGEHGGAEAVMAYFSSMDDRNLVILPTHRIVRFRAHVDMAAFRRMLAAHFALTELSADDPPRWLDAQLNRGEPHQFGFFAREWGWVHARLRSWQEVAGWIGQGHSEAWRTLDVVLLHEVVLGELLRRVAGSARAAHETEYTIDPLHGYRAVREGAADLFCMLRPPKAEELSAVVQAGDTMPQKSTYFYPKLLTGLVMRSLDEHEYP